MSTFQPFAFMSGPSGATPPAGFPYEADLFARYTFNEGTGTTVNDVSGNGVNLICNSPTVLGNQATGIFSGEFAADFTGGQKVAYNISSPFGCSLKPFTYSFWFNTASSINNQYLGRINRDSGCGTSFGQTAWIAGFTGSTLEVFSASQRFTVLSTMPINQWVFVTMTFSGTIGIGQVKAYVDGVFQAQNTNTSEQPPLAADVIIGASSENGGDALTGKVDQWSLHNFEMSAAQVTELYNWYTTNPNFIG